MATGGESDSAKTLDRNSERKLTTLTREGFDNKFVNAIDELDIECVFCVMVVRDARQISTCGHSFCATCWSDWCRSYDDVAEIRCPVDNELVDVNRVFEDRKLDRLIGGQKVYCMNEATGCLETPELRYLQDHEDTCPMKPLTCQYCHMEAIPRHQMPQHQKTECPNFPTLAQLTEKIDSDTLTAHHRALCDQVGQLEEWKMYAEETIKTLVTDKFKTSQNVDALYTEMTNDLKDCKKQINKLGNERDHATKEMNHAKKEMDDAKKEIDDAKKEIEKLNADRVRTDEKLNQLTMDMDILKKNAESANKTMEDMRKGSENPNKTIDDLKKQTEEMKSDTASASSRSVGDAHVVGGGKNVVQGQRNVCPYSWTVNLVVGVNPMRSPIFYTADGYGMFFQVQRERRSEFYVGARLCKADGDENRVWPWKGNEVMTITDAATGDVLEVGEVVGIGQPGRSRPLNPYGGNGYFLMYNKFNADWGNREITLTMKKP